MVSDICSNLQINHDSEVKEMRRAPTFSFIFFNHSIFEWLQEEELKHQQEQDQQQPQHLNVQRRQEQKRPNNSASVFVAS